MRAPAGGHREMDATAVVLVLLLSALWGGNVVAVKVGLPDSPPPPLAWMRFVLGGLCVLGWGWWTRAPFRPRPRQAWPLLCPGPPFPPQPGPLHRGPSPPTPRPP